MPDEKTYGFNIRDATDLLNGINSVEGTYIEGRVRTGGGGSASGRIFLTPSGGIAAAVGSTWGSATCTEHDEFGVSISTTATIYNQRTAIVPGNVFVLVLAVGSRLFVWESNCPTTIPEPDPDPDPEDPDPEPDPEPPIE